MQQPPPNHVVDAAAIVVPVAAVVTKSPYPFTTVLTILGIIWYCIQIGTWLHRRYVQIRQTNESSNRVAIVLNEERHGTDGHTPSAD